MRNAFVKIVIALMAITFVYIFALSLYRFASKAYYIDEAKLYRLDTFHLYNRAYSTIDNGKNAPEKLIFTSTNGYSFSIEEFVSLSIKNKKILEDTLMYHDLPFIVYTNKKYFKNYTTITYPVFIKVFQIQIGNEKYIDLREVNSLRKQGLILRIVLLIIFISCCILIYKNKFLRNKLFPST